MNKNIGLKLVQTNVCVYHVAEMDEHSIQTEDKCLNGTRNKHHGRN